MTEFEHRFREFMSKAEEGRPFKPEKWGPPNGLGFGKAPEWNGLPYQREFAARAGKTILRAHVFEKASSSTKRGIYWSLVWGFPDGKQPGENWSLKVGMANTHMLENEVDLLKAEAEAGHISCASVLLMRLNEARKHLSTASTTKVAYFARLPTKQGPALIMDKQALLGILGRNWKEFDALKNTRAFKGHEHLGDIEKRAYRALSKPENYREYVTHLHTLASSLNTRADDIERFLYNVGRREIASDIGKQKSAETRLRKAQATKNDPSDSV